VRSRTRALLLVVLSIVSPHVVSASYVEWTFEGQISTSASATATVNGVQLDFFQGQTFSGRIVYDDTARDLLSDPETGVYDMAGSPVQYALTVGTRSVVVDEYTTNVLDDSQLSSRDAFSAFFSDDFGTNLIARVEDADLNTLTSDAIPPVSILNSMTTGAFGLSGSTSVLGAMTWSFRVLPNRPDLQVVAFDAPLEITRGCEEYFVSTTVLNAGLESAGNFEVAVRLSDDATIDADDPRIASIRVFGLATGQSAALEIPVSVDTGVRSSFLGIVADDRGEVAESDEGNNVDAAAFSVPSPTITAIADVPNDQGREVILRFDGSSFDVAGSTTPIVQYEIFRRVDFSFARAGAPATRPVGMISSTALLAGGWVFVGSVPAHLESEYLALAPTDADSTAESGIDFNTFRVRAATASPGVFFESCPDSGYSVDDLAPNVPQNLDVADEGSVLELSWSPSEDEDLRFYRVYRGSSPDFPLDGMSLLTSLTATTWTDASAPRPAYYAVTAVDFAGNESDAATQEVATGAAPPFAGRFGLSPARPNPFNPRTTIRYELAESAPTHVNVLDAAGRHVATLATGVAGPGPVDLVWDGRDDARRGVASGVYFVHLSAGERRDTIRVVLVR